MPFIPAANTAQVRILQRLHDQKVTNTIYVTKNSAWGTDDLITLGGEIIDWWAEDFADNVSTNLVLEGVAVRSMQSESAPGVELGAPALTQGALPAQSCPGNVALVVKSLTGLTGRNARGRTYVAGITEVQAEGNLIAAVARDAIVNSFGLLRNRLIALGYNHVVASFYDGTVLELQPNGETIKVPVPRATALLTPIVSYRADVELDSQRRRLTGRGV